MTTFQAGLINLDLVFSLGKTPPTLMTDLLFKAQKYMNGEDALIVKGLTSKPKKDEARSPRARRRSAKIILRKLRLAKVV